MGIIKDIKHQLCVVAENHERSLSHFDRLSIENKCFQLPDGNNIKLDGDNKDASIITIDAAIKYSSSEIFFK